MTLGPRQQARNLEQLMALLGPLPPDGRDALKAVLPPDRVQALLKDLTRNLATGVRWQDKPAVTVPTAAQLLDCSRSGVYAFSHAGQLELLRSPTGRTLVSTKSIQELQNQMTPWVSPGRRIVARVE
jgi:hypothetical protein